MKPLFAVGLTAGMLVLGQQTVPNPTQQNTAVVQLDRTPIFRVNVVARDIRAVNYLHRGGSTKVDFLGTALMPQAKGSAKVESERGVIRVSAEFRDLVQPSTFGPEYLTY